MVLGICGVGLGVMISKSIYKDETALDKPKSFKLTRIIGGIGALSDLALFIMSALCIVLITTQFITLPYSKIWLIAAGTVIAGEPLITMATCIGAWSCKHIRFNYVP